MLKHVEELFNKKEKLTIDEIYSNLDGDLGIKQTNKILRHRIRSTIYSLKKQGKITRISQSTYKRN